VNAVYFLSDVHLGIGDPEHERQKRERLVHLLHSIRGRARRLVIVGDLFDFWFEYRFVIPRGNHAVLAALEDLVASGTHVSILRGNHDFAIGGFFSDDLGIEVIDADYEFSEDGRRFSVYHGDGLAINDGGYRLLKKIIRSRLAQFGFRILHPDLGFGMARLFSSSSRDYTSTKFYGETDGMSIDAERRIRGGADIVVMGHRHLPAKIRIGNGWYVNLGDWLTHYSYAVWRDGDIALFTCRNGDEEPLPE
jgi:UDP-2,3-diacylglucosamine hydrolase